MGAEYHCHLDQQIDGINRAETEVNEHGGNPQAGHQEIIGDCIPIDDANAHRVS